MRFKSVVYECSMYLTAKVVKYHKYQHSKFGTITSYLISVSLQFVFWLRLKNIRPGSDTSVETVMAVQAEPQYFTKARRAGRLVVDGQ